MNLFQIPQAITILYQVALTEREFAVLKKNVTKDIPDEIRYCAEQSGIQQQNHVQSGIQQQNYEHSGIQPQNYGHSAVRQQNHGHSHGIQ